MSEATLTNLLEYLYETLTPNNMQWLGEHLIEHANHAVKPYTMEELNAMLDEAEADIAAGRTISDEDVWREIEKELEEEALLEAV